MRPSPAQLVKDASIELLAEAVAGDGWPSFAAGAHDVPEARFTCPECRGTGGSTLFWLQSGTRSSGPSAVVEDDWRWRCSACGVRRTRWFLERLVLEDGALLDRFIRLHAQRGAA